MFRVKPFAFLALTLLLMMGCQKEERLDTSLLPGTWSIEYLQRISKIDGIQNEDFIMDLDEENPTVWTIEETAEGSYVIYNAPDKYQFTLSEDNLVSFTNNRSFYNGKEYQIVHLSNDLMEWKLDMTDNNYYNPPFMMDYSVHYREVHGVIKFKRI